MSIENIQIVTLALNNIKIDEQIQVDLSSDGDLSIKRDRHDREGDNIGLYVPYLSINGYNVTKFLRKFNLNLDGFLPVIRFTFYALESVFISVNYPKDGDIVSLYIKSPGNFYKPIRMDFNILSVISEPSSRLDPSGKDPEGKGKNLKFTITAECRIPGLYSQRIKSFRDLNSTECLLEVSQDLNLGFSTNETTTNDRMNWICPSYSYYDFIQEVCVRSYKDDFESFFDCWIDPYYNLNFVNMGSQFSYSSPVKQTAVFLPGANQGYSPSNRYAGVPETDPIEAPLVLTNGTAYGRIPYFIIGYTLVSRAGRNTNQMGYINQVCFYDENMDKSDPSEKYTKYDIESQTPESVGSGTVLQKGRIRENLYKEEKRIEWVGILNSRVDPDGKIDGVHQNFVHAKYQNLINLNDSTKMSLVVELEGYFPGIYRGQVIPVQIYVSESGLRQRNSGSQLDGKDNNIGTSTVDYFLSGNYVVTGMSVYWSYTGGGMRQSLTLCKRVWNLNSSGNLPKAFPISASENKF